MNMSHCLLVHLTVYLQLAAQRFVEYWECRRQIFGDKFVLPMTLSGALRDDLAAIEAGVFYLLPRLDPSGRPLILFEPSRNTRDGYTSESLVRATSVLAGAVLIVQ